MSSTPNISKAEWQIMKAVWTRSSATAVQIIDDLKTSTSWKPKTIMTMLKRLVDKGALSYDKQGRAFVYYPIVDESDCARAEGKSLLKRVYGGALVPMMAHFVEDVKLSESEIRDLKRLLVRKGKG